MHFEILELLRDWMRKIDTESQVEGCREEFRRTSGISVKLLQLIHSILLDTRDMSDAPTDFRS